MAVSLGKLLGAGRGGNHQAIVLEQGLQPAGGALLVDQLDHAVCHGFLAGRNAGLHHAGINIKKVQIAVDRHNAFGHGAVHLVKVIGAVIVGIPAFYHVAVGVIPHPLAGAVCVFGPVAGFGFLVYILADGFSTLLHVIQPVPGIGGRIIDFFAAVGCIVGIITLALASLVPVIFAVHAVPHQVAANAGGGIKAAGQVVHHNIALGHGAGDQVKVIGAVIVGIPTFDHMAVGIVAHPFAAVGFLVYILADGFCAALVGVQPVPGVGIGVVNLFAAAGGTLFHAVLVPVILAVHSFPTGVGGNTVGGFRRGGLFRQSGQCSSTAQQYGGQNGRAAKTKLHGIFLLHVLLL